MEKSSKNDVSIGYILKSYLKDNGFDGFCNPDTECGCGGDLLCWCDSIPFECRPAVKIECNRCENESSCDKESRFDRLGCYQIKRKGDKSAKG